MWTYRVTRQETADGQIIFSIRECYTSEHSKPPYTDKDFTSWTENEIAPVGDSVDDLKWVLNEMLKACDKSVIDIGKSQHD